MLAQIVRLRRRAKPRRGEREIFAAEQIGVGEQEGDGVDARHEQQQQRHQIDDGGDQRKAQRHHQGVERRRRLADAAGGIDLAFDVRREVVDEKSGDQDRNRADQEGQRHEEPRAGGESENSAQQRMIHHGDRQRQFVEPRPGKREQQQREAEAFIKHGPKRRREDLAQAGEGGFEHGASCLGVARGKWRRPAASARANPGFLNVAASASASNYVNRESARSL